jgi:cytochrome c553
MARFNPDARVDQEAKYRTSVHGEKLAQGDTKVASCISCHGRHPGGEKSAALAHGIRAVGDPQSPVHPLNVAATCGRCHGDAQYMAEYGIPTDQREQYEQSVHRAALVEKEDLAAPTCNDCHGNHGARPPEVESMAFVCGTCHGKQAELFRQTTMKPAFDEAELGECIVCHGNHRHRRAERRAALPRAAREGAAATGLLHLPPGRRDAALAISTAVHADLGGPRGVASPRRARRSRTRTPRACRWPRPSTS